MLIRLFCAVLSYSAVLLRASADNNSKFEVAYEWNYINYTWPSAEAMSSAGYVPGEDVIAGIKIYKNVIYLALPRIKPSSRVTLASIPIDANKENPLLSPFPSWEMNSGSTCDAIQNVLSMEIDKDGIMWVLDARRVDNNTDCPPKIILLDLNDKGKIVNDFLVPDELCPRNRGCFLNDIVVDGDYAYISDTTSSDPGIFVYHRDSNSAWKARDKSMFGDPNAVRFEAQGVENEKASHINGIALCCGETERTFFFMPQTSLHVFSISNSILKNRSIATGSNLHNFITDEGTKQGQSGGMMCDTASNIYYGILPLNAVGKWNIKKPLLTAEIVEKNDEIIRWPDSFSIYKDYLYLITNSISKFSKSGIDKSEINFRIIKLKTDTRSYIYC
ncbi:hypothetical protein Zmor_007352 [Zophobas morio]|uniref:Bee-milk protein n=1 Tax=Zophobas morio TaxID=2755281 RepID=A0AA38IRX2_9CUCU|nr:hypothetical protein Zmor_007352 [Zophobas morio]